MKFEMKDDDYNNSTKIKFRDSNEIKSTQIIIHTKRDNNNVNEKLNHSINRINSYEEKKSEYSKSNKSHSKVSYLDLNESYEEKSNSYEKSEESEKSKKKSTKKLSHNFMLNDYPNDNSSNSNNSNNKNSDFDIIIRRESRFSESNKNICQLCDEVLNEEEIEKIIIPCGHIFCVSCWQNYIEERLKNSNEIICMQKNCLKEIPKETILKIINSSKDLMSKFDLFELKKEVLKNPNMKFCPYPDCDGIGKISDINNKKLKYVTCSKGHNFCFFCLQNWHGDKPCEKENDLLIKWGKKNAQKCPNCKVWIEKINGCNHIICFNCKYEFCWLCLNKYEYDHYQLGGCSQYIDWKICHFCLFRFLYKFFIFIFFYLLMCLFSLPIFVYPFIERVNFCLKGLILVPIFIIFEIPFFIISFIILIISICNRELLEKYPELVSDFADIIKSIFKLD